MVVLMAYLPVAIRDINAPFRKLTLCDPPLSFQAVKNEDEPLIQWVTDGRPRAIEYTLSLGDPPMQVLLGPAQTVDHPPRFHVVHLPPAPLTFTHFSLLSTLGACLAREFFPDRSNRMRTSVLLRPPQTAMLSSSESKRSPPCVTMLFP